MNQRIKKLWIKALRSGKYKQAQGQLRKDNGKSSFCCLGVLCDIHSRTKDGVDWEGDEYLDNDSDLPTEVVEWAGLDSCDPKLGRKHHAAFLNDQGKSFSFIADRIEKYL